MRMANRNRNTESQGGEPTDSRRDNDSVGAGQQRQREGGAGQSDRSVGDDRSSASDLDDMDDDEMLEEGDEGDQAGISGGGMDDDVSKSSGRRSR
jgi:hypothetical protein